jgi:hypothetical protein
MMLSHYLRYGSIIHNPDVVYYQDMIALIITTSIRLLAMRGVGELALGSKAS